MPSFLNELQCIKTYESISKKMTKTFNPYNVNRLYMN